MNLTARWGNNILDNGFLAIPNVLIDKQEELGISDDELLFIIKTMRHHESFKIHDSQISKSLNPKTLQRRRQSLKEKGYLETQVYKVQDDDGTWSTTGIIYDYKNLLLALNDVAPKTETNENELFGLPSERTVKAKGEPPKSTLHNTIYNTTREEFKKFEADYKSKYGKSYRYSSEEKQMLANASEDFISSIKYIFDYTNERLETGDLEATFVPRLIFFLKVDFRQAQLIEFAKDREYEEEQSKKVAASAEEYLSEEKEFYNKLHSKNQTLESFAEYLKSINNRNWLYLHNGSITLNVLREVSPIVDTLES